MVNRPKAIGTKAESATLKVVKRYFPDADRAALHGASDIGDLMNTGDFCFEVKGGQAAKDAVNASQSVQITKWLAETERERKLAGRRFGVLVVQRGGVNYPDADRWWAIVTAAALADIMGAPGHQNSAPVRLELGTLLDILADQGYTPDVPARAA